MSRPSDRRRLLLLPYEQTTSYQRGAGGGPLALLPFLTPHPFASWDCPETKDVPPETYLGRVAAETEKITRAGLKVAALGGEHTVTYGVLAGLIRAGQRPSIVQLDAHADLRPDYEGTPWSHACVMRRVAEDLGLPTLGLGIRSLSIEEAAFLKETGRPVVFAHRLREADFSLADATTTLGRDIYLTVDIDFLDPSVVPGTGTPEPGGLGWYEALDLLDALLEGRNLVGFDLVELAPALEGEISVRAAARLAACLADHL